MIRSILLTALLLFAGESFAASCVKTGSVCVDTGDANGCKVINSVKVCLSDPAINATCWKYTDTYNCMPPGAVNYCAAINTTTGCAQVSSTCSASDSTGCTRWTNTYQCGGGTTPAINTVVLNSSYTMVTAPSTATQCATPAANPTCTLANATTNDYSCISQSSNCDALQQNTNCTLSTSTCISGVNPNCTLSQNIYQCLNTPASSSITVNCGAEQYCTGSNCFNSGHTPDTDLANAVAANEVMREAGVYMTGDQKIFSGDSRSCIQDSLGNCCESSSGATNNSSIGQQIKRTAGGQVLKAGSKYVYDIVTNVYHDAQRGMGAMAAVASGAGDATFSLSTYGISMTYSAGAAGSGLSFGFDPTSLAIELAIVVIVDLMSCSSDEKTLAMENGAHLCRKVGSECLGTFCPQVKQTYCCFNSVLSKIVNTAATVQLGKAYTDCSGLTTAQFGQLDFSKIDMSEFTASISSSVQLPSTGAINTDVGNTIQTKMNNYYTKGQQ